jgi:uncharacterized Zn finger protein
MSWYGYGWRPYVSVAQRRANVLRHVDKLRKKGQTISPVEIDGRTIARTFWGKAWCENLESYSDFANRLPRGRTYVRNGSVVHLEIAPGKITALVSGSEVYHVTIQIKRLQAPRWQTLKRRCAGRISSVLELLQGRFDRGVMEVITARDEGLFPAPKEIELDCSCPDWADMCKHVAAVLYGVGARLDHAPELLFQLRQVDHLELIQEAVSAQSLTPAAAAGRKTLAETELADVFGIDLAKTPAATGTTASAAAAPTPAAPPVIGVTPVAASKRGRKAISAGSSTGKGKIASSLKIGVVSRTKKAPHPRRVASSSRNAAGAAKRLRPGQALPVPAGAG